MASHISLFPLLLYCTTHITTTIVAATTTSSPLLATITLPPSCTCSHTSSSPHHCQTFSCRCSCDITPNVCDIDCCCDDDCDDRQQQPDGDNGVCSSSTNGDDVTWVNMCYETKGTLLEEVNLRDRHRVDSLPRNALMNNLLCVKKDNSAVKGHFYVDNLGYPSSSRQGEDDMTTTMTTKPYSYNTILHSSSKEEAGDYYQEALSFFSGEVGNADDGDDGGFRRGDGIPIMIKKQDQNNDNGGKYSFGMWQRPSASDGGFCNDLNLVEFGNDAIPSTVRGCYRVLLPVESWDGDGVEGSSLTTPTCDQSWGVDRYVTNLFVGKKRHIIVTSSNDVNHDDFLPITPHDSFSSSSIHSSVTTMNNNNNNTVVTCHNVVRHITYHVLYNDETHSLTRITVPHLETINVTLQRGVGLYQYVSILFLPEVLDGAADPPQKRSGNPGYRWGYPVLAGRLSASDGEDSSSPVVTTSRHGIIIPNQPPPSTGGRCDTIHRNNNDDMTTNPLLSFVTFGEDMFVGCTQTLTRSRLRRLCKDNNDDFLLPVTIDNNSPEDSTILYVPRWLVFDDITLVGIYGNANPKDPGQWLPFEFSWKRNGDDNDEQPQPTVKSRSWFENKYQCVNLPTRLHFHFRWTYVGRMDDPQAKIISATAEYNDERVLKHTIPGGGDDDVEMAFEFVTTVTWTFVESGREVVSPPRPRFLFRLPDDLFYPFEIGGGGGRGPWGSLMVMMMVVGWIITM